MNLVENGSFEKLILFVGIGFVSGYDLVVIVFDKFYCFYWNVEFGKVWVVMMGLII